MKITCCTNCVPPKRHACCHSTCSEYIQQKEAYDKRNDAIRQAKSMDNLLTGHQILSIQRAAGRRKYK